MSCHWCLACSYWLLCAGDGPTTLLWWWLATRKEGGVDVYHCASGSQLLFCHFLEKGVYVSTPYSLAGEYFEIDECSHLLSLATPAVVRSHFSRERRLPIKHITYRFSLNNSCENFDWSVHGIRWIKVNQVNRVKRNAFFSRASGAV